MKIFLSGLVLVVLVSCTVGLDEEKIKNDSRSRIEQARENYRRGVPNNAGPIREQYKTQGVLDYFLWVWCGAIDKEA